MRRTTVVVVVVGLLVAACADDDDALDTVPQPSATSSAPETTLPPTTSAAPETTVVATTVQPSPSSTEPAPTTAPPPPVTDDRWSPACVEQPGRTELPTTVDDPVLDAFGPLGTKPGLAITLPLGPPEQSTEPPVPSVPSVQVERVPGGLAMLVRPSSYGDDRSGAILTVLQHDGSVRWRRCITGIDAGELLAGGSTILVGAYGPGGSIRWLGFDPVSGDDRQSPAEIAGFSAHPWSERFVLLRRFDEQLIAAGEEMALFDRTTGELEAVPYPPGSDGKVPGEVEFVFSGDVLVNGDGYRPAIAVYDGAAWLSDADSLVAMIEPAAVYDYDGAGWTGRDGAGNVLWSRPDWVDVFGEGFRSIATDGVTLLVACQDGIVDETTGLCVDALFAGVETATGNVLWERPGFHAAPVAGNGLAIVTTPDFSYEMIDVRTGERIDDSQVWPGGAFQQGCCGEDEHLWTARSGGIVVATDYERVNVYYPSEFTTETVSISLI